MGFLKSKIKAIICDSISIVIFFLIGFFYIVRVGIFSVKIVIVIPFNGIVCIVSHGFTVCS